MWFAIGFEVFPYLCLFCMICMADRMLPSCAGIFQAEVQVSVAFCCEPSGERNSTGCEVANHLLIKNPRTSKLESFSCHSRLHHPLFWYGHHATSPPVDIRKWSTAPLKPDPQLLHSFACHGKSQCLSVMGHSVVNEPFSMLLCFKLC